MSDAPANKSNEPFRILSLDGGGAKGVYTLGVLREVEALAGKPLCEVFDLIFGTSTGSIIAALIGLGYPVDEIEKLYFDLVPKIMSEKISWTRMTALKAEAERVFGDKDFSAFKTMIGIVCTNTDRERPMTFKNSGEQAHGRRSTFIEGFGRPIKEAVIASCAAYPFFRKYSVTVANLGKNLLMDGGYVANNPTLFAIADAHQALGISISKMAILSVGVGYYNEPKKSFFHQALFSLWPFRHLVQMFNISSKTIEQLREILFPQVPCVRISNSYPDPELATDLLESDIEKLRKLYALGRDCFAAHEVEIKEKLNL